MAKERMYRDFMVELRGFDETTGTYEVALPPTPEYGEPDPVSASLDYDQIETDLGDLEAKQIYIEDLIPLGQRLMDRLLPEGPLRQHMVAAIKNAKQDEGVRLRLLIRDARLAQLPWESATYESPKASKTAIILWWSTPRSRWYAMYRWMHSCPRSGRPIPSTCACCR